VDAAAPEVASLEAAAPQAASLDAAAPEVASLEAAAPQAATAAASTEVIAASSAPEAIAGSVAPEAIASSSIEGTELLAGAEAGPIGIALGALAAIGTALGLELGRHRSDEHEVVTGAALNPM